MGSKRMISVVIALVMLLAAIPFVTVSASTNDMVTPFYTNTSSITASLSFSGTTAQCYSTVTGLSGTTQITATMYLYQVNSDGTLSLLNSWNASSSGTLLTVSGTNVVTSGSTYRLLITANVTRNGTTESVSNFDERTAK